MKFFPPRATSFVCRDIDYRLLDPRRVVFAANSFIASMMAIYIAFQLDLQRPYWAMLTVYLTSQPLVGALRSKALFRIVGTVLGASAAVILVPAFVNEPLLLSLAITAWAGFCLYVSLLDRTPRSYAFMLAGYTATTVAFSSVTAPDAVFATALARVEEIALGIPVRRLYMASCFHEDISGVSRTTLRSPCAMQASGSPRPLLGHSTAAGNRDRMRLGLRCDRTGNAVDAPALRFSRDQAASVGGSRLAEPPGHRATAAERRRRSVGRAARGACPHVRAR